LGKNLARTKTSIINNSNGIELGKFSFSDDIFSLIKAEIEDSIKKDIMKNLSTKMNGHDESTLLLMRELQVKNVLNNPFNKQNRSVTNCKHINKKHYAKGMCYNCYHRQGRNKKAWECGHRNKPHYAKGLCNSCYQVHTFNCRNEG
jgi:hypothetical protein